MINESLSPEVQKRASEIFKSIIDSQVDKLLVKYGKDAEKVAYSTAIKQAKKELEDKKDIEEINYKKHLQELNKSKIINSLTEQIFNKLKNNDSRGIKTKN